MAARFNITPDFKPSTPLSVGTETIGQTQMAANGENIKKVKKSENVLAKDIATLPPNDVAEFQSLIGSLLYLDGTRPDLTFSIHYLARKIRDPCAADVQQARRVLGYALKTKERGLTYRGSRMPEGEMNVVYAYSDASYAQNGDHVHQRKSCTGYALMMNGAAISWHSKLQSTRAGSTVHAEVNALYSCVCDIVGIRTILEFLGYAQTAPSPIFEDSNGALKLAYRSEVDYKRSQSYDVAVWRIREFIEQGAVHAFLIPGNDNPADMLTKSLSQQAILRYASVLMGIELAVTSVGSQ